jgi:hypothetical protein
MEQFDEWKKGDVEEKKTRRQKTDEVEEKKAERQRDFMTKTYLQQDTKPAWRPTYPR